MKGSTPYHFRHGIRFRIKERSAIARIAAWKLGVSQVAITIGDTIHLHGCISENLLNNERWLRHELEHIRQFKRHGFFSFIGLYLAESVRRGYRNNRYEIEARNAENSTEST